MRQMYLPSIYKHDQSVLSDTWIINHNIGNNGSSGLPVVDTFVVLDGNPQKIIPSAVTFINKNTVQITFSEPQVGFAVIIV